jgi:hypothetical protein
LEIAKLFFTISFNPGPVIQTSAGSRFRSIAKLFFTIIEPSLLVPDALLLPVSATVILVVHTVTRLVAWVAFPPLFAAIGTGLVVIRINDDLLAMIIRSPAALAFGRMANLLFRMKWRRIERFAAVGANRFPGFHLGLRAWIGPVILCQEKSNQE